ncbi:AAA family ATPase [uncultured Psychrobacter sp.]|uniref:AAA family ATPase n=1 Tax=uncultured Psychrobacter sp. TaxID=259303 RepID=UPI0026250F9F|nr:AAA family ATPase [uncultured Psychrobacter sp.]
MEETIKLWFKEGYTDFNSGNGLNRNSPFELKRLNIIVGANNAGKSRFMREFIFKLKVNSVDFKYPQAYKDYISIINSFICNHSSKHQLEIPDNSLCSLEDILRQWQNTGSFLTDTRKAIEAHITYSTSSIKYDTLEYAIVTGKLSHEVRKLIDDIDQLIEGLSNIKNTLDSLSFKALKFYYIDSLRSLRKLNSQIISIDAESEHYPLLSRTLTDYSFEKDEIISGEDFFGLLTDSLLGKPDERQRIQSYQEKLSHYFFNNEVITIIPHLRTDSIEIKIGEAEQFPISKLGDGLQQIIILTYKAFLTTEPSFFFIEEPEMHLHAGYVKQLMKFLLNETDHYYMATSHSNYLLDMINEDKRIALYRVDKEQIDDEENKYETVIKRCDGDRTILQTLGVSPSSVFLANCTIWIEGITDRLYFVQYLKKYLEELKTTDEEKWQDYSRFIDGYHYAFVEYQGSNLDHWDFSIESPASVDSSQNKGLSALLITSNALVVADSDLQGKPRFNELKEQLGDNMIITLGKETENTLPRELLIKRFYQKCPQNAVSTKGNTTKISYKDEHENYFNDSYLESDKGVGTYLDNVITEMRTNNIFPSLEGEQESFTFSDKGAQGTVKGKTDFCHAIVELMQTEDWQLTEPAIELCESIFQHIKRNND